MWQWIFEILKYRKLNFCSYYSFSERNIGWTFHQEPYYFITHCCLPSNAFFFQDNITTEVNSHLKTNAMPGSSASTSTVLTSDELIPLLVSITYFIETSVSDESNAFSMSMSFAFSKSCRYGAVQTWAQENMFVMQLLSCDRTINHFSVKKS